MILKINVRDGSKDKVKAVSLILPEPPRCLRLL